MLNILKKRTFTVEDIDFVGVECFILLKITTPFKFPVYKSYKGGGMNWHHRPLGKWTDEYADYETSLFLNDAEQLEMHRIAENRKEWLKKFIADAKEIIGEEGNEIR